MFKDQKELLCAFNEQGVEYLIVGGHAVSRHSEPRATKDLDVFIRPDEGNSEKVYRALAKFGADLDGITPADFRDEAATMFQLGRVPFRIDILQRIDAVDFDRAWRNRVSGLVDGEVPAFFISREDLIQNKLASGRLRDLADVEEIRKAVKANSGDTE